MSNFKSFFSFSFVWLALYVLGCGFSQSLMSLSGGLGILGALFCFKFVSLRWKNFRNPEKFVFLFLNLWLGFSLINLALHPFSETTEKSLLRILLWLIPSIAVLVPKAKLQDFKILNPFFLILILAGLIPSVAWSAYQFFVLKTHAFGLMKNTNYFAYNLLPPLAFGLHVFKVSLRSFEKKLSLFLVGLCLLGLVFSLSRTALATGLGLSLFVGLGLYFSKKSVTKKAWVGIFVFLSLLMGGLFQSPLFKEKFQRSLSGSDPSFQWRVEAWKYNFDLFSDSILWGVGYEQNGIDVVKLPHLQGHWEGGRKIFAHNIFIQTLGDSGLIGFVLLYGFLILCLVAYPSTRILIIPIFIAGLTENSFTNSRSFHPFLLYLSLLVILERQSLNETTLSAFDPKRA